MAKPLPEHLFAAYAWIEAAGEIDLVATMTEAEIDDYAADAAANADDAGADDVTELDIWRVWFEIRNTGQGE